MNPVVSGQPPISAAQYAVEIDGGVKQPLTAAEVAVLLEENPRAGLRVYRVHRALPDGRMELVAVPVDRFQLEDCFLFYSRDAAAARADFDALRTLGRSDPPPCRAKLQLADLEAGAHRFVVALLYPAEYAEEMSAWLLRHAYRGGVLAEGGMSQVPRYYEAARNVLDRHQFWGTQDGTLSQADRSVRGAAGA